MKNTRALPAAVVISELWEGDASDPDKATLKEATVRSLFVEGGPGGSAGGTSKHPAFPGTVAGIATAVLAAINLHAPSAALLVTLTGFSAPYASMLLGLIVICAIGVAVLRVRNRNAAAPSGAEAAAALAMLPMMLGAPDAGPAGLGGFMFEMVSEEPTPGEPAHHAELRQRYKESLAQQHGNGQPAPA